MNLEISTAWAKVQGMINGAIALLPNIGLALIVFFVFVFIGGWIKKFVKRLTRNRRQARNLGMVLPLSSGIHNSTGSVCSLIYCGSYL
jgi:hypothetical protein